MPIFSSKATFLRFIEVVEYYQFANTPVSFSDYKKLRVEQREEIFQYLQKENNLHIEILAFCLMDNHYHFLIKQLTENGITTWMSNVQIAYARYFNIKSNRSGPLFQPQFKAVRIETDEQLLHVSRYIHLNPSTGYLVDIDDLPSYHWSSLSCYIEHSCSFSFVKTDLILGMMKKKQTYRDFVFDQANYQRELAKIKHLLLE